VNTPIPVFIGYDRRVPIVYQVATHSIVKRASCAVSTTPLMIKGLRDSGLMTRPLQPNQSTEFSFSRFLVPYLMNYQGWALFVDNDVVMLEDIAELWALRDDDFAVMCVKHNHVPEEGTKFLGEAQTQYEKKNWSSVMLINCSKCTALTPDYVNSASGLELHRFHWLGDDELIGEIPSVWNFLIDYSPGDLKDQKLLHYTDGGPYYSSHLDCQFASVWTGERDDMLKSLEQSLGDTFPEEMTTD